MSGKTPHEPVEQVGPDGPVTTPASGSSVDPAVPQDAPRDTTPPRRSGLDEKGRVKRTRAGTVWASIPVFGRDFQASHLALAIQVMTGLADELDDRLHGEFGGKRFFGEGDKPAGNVPEARIGQYL